jgi:uncharacterized membrane-anchored protein
MSRRHLFSGLVVVVLFQVGVLAGEYLNAVYPLWTGREVRLRTMPVDPRSLFRGNYARLDYEISRIPEMGVSEEKSLRPGEIVYVSLREGKDGLYEYEGAGLARPQEGLFIRGRVQEYSQEPSVSLRVRYGIEALFAPPEKALALEKELRRSGIAVVMIADNGKPALKDVISGR